MNFDGKYGTLSVQFLAVARDEWFIPGDLPTSRILEGYRAMDTASVPFARGAALAQPGLLVGYIRVSTDEEHQKTVSQEDALHSAGVDPRHIFVDQMSGGRIDRPGLDSALNYLRPGDTLVVWKLDRLGRSLHHLMTILQGLRDRGIAFRSLTESIDTMTTSGAFLFHILGAVAEYERELLRERIHAGLASARRRGHIGGRPRVIAPEQLEAIQAAHAKGMSKAAICRTFGVKRTTLYEALARMDIQ